ncbi:DUF1223 domain-containing protein [Porphyrobacter sp. YT40]|uniref:DUF1223 domain-containing protein n=1 Tax=Porphyrobacter sp. YT40 TaxID=2547601 RepID=UPI0011439C72|nr:DUF1223 domain-containing protein [Porphyrobacter sp. YT40]QDH33383.1 DUF1223 domain-containing protein [Porphyrobacter sp. YT40]
MTPKHSLFALTGLVAVIGAAALAFDQPATPRAATPPAKVAPGEPVLVELFTSQGCSSCPPADVLAAKLARDPRLVVISRPVTYWDRLGWTDTLGREENTTLQQDYARRGLAGRNGVYTPQTVVDGRFGAVGSYSDDIAAGVREHGGKGAATLRAKPQAGGGYTVALTGKTAAPAELVLLAVTRMVEVDIGRGENGGRKLGYTNVLRAEHKLADWRGGAAQVTVAAADLKVAKADRYALVLRQPDGGRVLAARWLS